MKSLAEMHFPEQNIPNRLILCNKFDQFEFRDTVPTIHAVLLSRSGIFANFLYIFVLKKLRVWGIGFLTKIKAINFFDSTNMGHQQLQITSAST